jgi:hypothetical protein
VTDAGALLAELDDLRRQRVTLRGRRGRQVMDELRRLTRRELTIEAKLLPKASSTSAGSDPEDRRELKWWQE